MCEQAGRKRAAIFFVHISILEIHEKEDNKK